MTRGVRKTAALDVCQKQHAVMKFLCCENEAVTNIQKRLRKMYGDDALDSSAVSR